MFSPCAILHQKLKQRGVAQVFLEISAVAQIFGIDLRDGKAVAAKMPGEFQERDVLFAHVIENADRALTCPPASRTMMRPEPPSWPCSGCTRSAGEWKCCSKSSLRTSMDMIFNGSGTNFS